MPLESKLRKLKTKKHSNPLRNTKSASNLQLEANSAFADTLSSDALKSSKQTSSMMPPPFKPIVNSTDENNEEVEFTDLNSVDSHYHDETQVQRGNLKDQVSMTSNVYKNLMQAQLALKAMKKKKGTLEPSSSVLSSLHMAATVANVDNYDPGLVTFYTIEELTNLSQDLLIKLKTFIVLQSFPIQIDGEIDTKKLDATLVEYSSEREQQETLVRLQGGKLYRASGLTVNTNISTTYMQGLGKEIFVMGHRGNIHMASHKLGKFHHSSLLSGSDVAFAGEIKVINGEVKWLSNKSGHYKPTESQLISFLKHFEKLGLSLHFALDINVMMEEGGLQSQKFASAKNYLDKHRAMDESKS